MDDLTVRTIVAMIDSRRVRLDAEWRQLERGTAESAENLAAGSALADLKWAILDVQSGKVQLDDAEELMIAPDSKL